jgi:SAM-dependent methyltransferase
VRASEFYTGLVAEMYDELVSHRAPAAFYADLVRSGRGPALELGCGTGHPLLELVAEGLGVEGLDSSPDMLARCEAKARAKGLAVELHQQEMQSFALGRRFRTIYVAGSSLMLLPDAEDAARALQRIHHHLEPGGRAAISLYVPPLSADARSATGEWRSRETTRADGATLRCSEKFHFDWPHQLRVSVLRYEVIVDGAVVDQLERPLVLRWYGQREFGRLLRKLGFSDCVAVREDGAPVADDSPAFVFLATRPE